MYALARVLVGLYTAWAVFFLCLYALTGNYGGVALMAFLGGIVLIPWNVYKRKRQRRLSEEGATS